MKILVVEHNGDGTSLMKVKMIRKWGYESELASTDQEALVMLSRNLYDMVILDIDLPSGNGYDLIPHIKKFHPDMYIATMTAYNSRELEKKVRTQGVIYYMIKPFDMNEVKDIAEHIHRKKFKEVRYKNEEEVVRV